MLDKDLLTVQTVYHLKSYSGTRGRLNANVLIYVLV